MAVGWIQVLAEEIAHSHASDVQAHLEMIVSAISLPT